MLLPEQLSSLTGKEHRTWRAGNWACITTYPMPQTRGRIIGQYKLLVDWLNPRDFFVEHTVSL